MKFLKIILFISLSSCKTDPFDWLRPAEKESIGILAARCLTKEEYSDSEYSIFYDDLHCLEQLALCEKPCDRKSKACEKHYFTRDENKCREENSVPCYKECKEKFPCNTQTNKRLSDCIKKWS